MMRGERRGGEAQFIFCRDNREAQLMEGEETHLHTWNDKHKDMHRRCKPSHVYVMERLCVFIAMQSMQRVEETAKFLYNTSE